MQSLIWYIVALEPAGKTKVSMESYILLLGIMILTGFMLISVRRKIRRSKERDGLSVKERLKQETQGREVYTQIGELMAELADLSRQINGQIDMRLAKMDILLRETDQKIEKLQQLTGTKIDFKNNISDAVILSPTAETKVQPLLEKEKATDPVVEEVLKLKSKGMSSVAIAQQLDRPVGEIELILAIRRKPGFSG